MVGLTPKKQTMENEDPILEALNTDHIKGYIIGKLSTNTPLQNYFLRIFKCIFYESTDQQFNKIYTFKSLVLDIKVYANELPEFEDPDEWQTISILAPKATPIYFKSW